jgi:hypothetical protein
VPFPNPRCGHGGSNDIANLYYPEKANAHRTPVTTSRTSSRTSWHDLVCDGTMTLRSVQRQIATNWQAPYKRVFGVTPSA